MSKTKAKTAPGLKRLRASPPAESIRAAVLADQPNGRAEALAKIEAEKAEADDAIDLPANFSLGKAAKTAKGGPSPVPAPQARANGKRPASAPRKASGKRAERLAAALAGSLPAPPDFTAETHRRFRAKLAEVVALAEAGDVEGLRAWTPSGFIGSSVKAIIRYRDLALVALEARTARAAA